VKIDIFAHILPKKYLAAFRAKVRSGSDIDKEKIFEQNAIRLLRIAI